MEMHATQQVHLDGHPMSEDDIRRGLKVSTWAGFSGMAWCAISMGVPLTMLMECLTGSGVLIGLVVTIQQLTMLVQIPSALCFEGLPSRKKIWAVLAMTHRLLWLIPAIIPLFFFGTPSVAATIIIIGIAVSALLAQMCGPMWQSWMAELVPARISGRFWGIRQSLVTISFLLATALSGWILDFFPDPRKAGGSYVGFAIVFSIATLLGMLDIFIHMFVPEPKPGLYQKHQSLSGLIDRITAPLKISDFRWMTFSISLWYLGCGVVGSFGIVYLKREFNFSYTGLSMLAVSASLGPVIFGILNGYMIDKIGARAFTSILMFVTPMLGVVWFFLSHSTINILGYSIPEPLVLLLIANFFGGALGGGVGIAQLHMINLLSPKNGRGMAIAVHWTIIGLMAAAGPLIGGMVMDYMTKNPSGITLFTGLEFSYMHVLLLIFMAVVIFVAAPMMLKLKIRAGELPLNEVFGSIKVGNPLRGISIVSDIYQTALGLVPENIDDREKKGKFSMEHKKDGEHDHKVR